jgi:aminomethyltransferase
MATMELKRTPLYETHRRLGGKLVPFAGWEMPIQYAGVLAEHQAVRTAAGLFDVSHMGRIEITGRYAGLLIARVATLDADKLAPGRMQYAVALNEAGGILDDIMVYRLAEERYFLCVNASNRTKIHDAVLKQLAGFAAVVTERSAAWAQIAIQGPLARAIAARNAKPGLLDLPPRAVAEVELAGVPMIVSRSGYTGEPGFELYLPAAAAADVWNKLYESGRGEGLRPCGLGCRDTLRLEMGYALYGNDIDETTSPLEAGLEFAVDFDNRNFIGRPALLEQRERGVGRRLVGFELLEPGVPRHGFRILYNDAPVGVVTSGNHSPMLGKGIGLAYVAPERAAIGTRLEVEIRSNRAPISVTKTPFYRRKKSA